MKLVIFRRVAQYAATCFRVYRVGASHVFSHHPMTAARGVNSVPLPSFHARGTTWDDRPAVGDAPTVFTRSVRASGLGRLYDPDRGLDNHVAPVPAASSPLEPRPDWPEFHAPSSLPIWPTMEWTPFA